MVMVLVAMGMLVMIEEIVIEVEIAVVAMIAALKAEEKEEKD